MRRVRLHDVVRAYLRYEHGAARPDLDCALVEAYRSRCPAGWATGPDDGYFFQQLLPHLTSAGEEQDVRSLLQSCDWIEAKLRATSIGALLADYGEPDLDRGVRAVGQALRLSAHVLAKDPTAVFSQLLGRIDSLGAQARVVNREGGEFL